MAAFGAGAEVAVVDALDENLVEGHADSVVAAAGGIDVSINVISRGDVQGTPLAEMSAEDLMAPVVMGLRTNFLTARAAARRMARQGSGVILTVTSGSSRGAHPGQDPAAGFGQVAGLAPTPAWGHLAGPLAGQRRGHRRVRLG